MQRGSRPRLPIGSRAMGQGMPTGRTSGRTGSRNVTGRTVATTGGIAEMGGTETTPRVRTADVGIMTYGTTVRTVGTYGTAVIGRIRTIGVRITTCEATGRAGMGKDVRMATPVPRPGRRGRERRGLERLRPPPLRSRLLRAPPLGAHLLKVRSVRARSLSMSIRAMPT